MSTTLSLYEKLGGEAGVESLVVAFYVKVMADPDLSPFFRHTTIEKLHAMQKDFFTMALGGPDQYSGLSLAAAHHGRGIKMQHFSRFVAHLLATLEDLGIETDEAEAVCARINTHANEILGVSY